MSRVLLRTAGGDLCLPDPKTIMIDRARRRPAGGATRRGASGSAPRSTPRELVAVEPARRGHRPGDARVPAAARRRLHQLLGRRQLGAERRRRPAGPKRGPDAPRPAPARDRPQPALVATPTGAGVSRRSSRLSSDRFAWSRGKSPLTPAECARDRGRGCASVLSERYGVRAADAAAGATRDVRLSGAGGADRRGRPVRDLRGRAADEPAGAGRARSRRHHRAGRRRGAARLRRGRGGRRRHADRRRDCTRCAARPSGWRSSSCCAGYARRGRARGPCLRAGFSADCCASTRRRRSAPVAGAADGDGWRCARAGVKRGAQHRLRPRAHDAPARAARLARRRRRRRLRRRRGGRPSGAVS